MKAEPKMDVGKADRKTIELGRVRAVLFDLFDTLLLVRSGGNFSESCLRNVYNFLSMNGVSVSFEDFRRMYSEVRRRLYERSRGKLEEPHFRIRIHRILRELGYNHDISSPIVKGAVNAYSEEFMRHVHLDGDALPVLRRLRENNYKTGVISNFAIPECARKLISAHGLKNLLDVVVISADINRRKPSPEIFNFALNLLEVNASESIFVGDTPDIDVVGAKKAGMKAILIERRKADFRGGEKPDLAIKRLREILDFL